MIKGSDVPKKTSQSLIFIHLSTLGQNTWGKPVNCQEKEMNPLEWLETSKPPSVTDRPSRPEASKEGHS